MLVGEDHSESQCVFNSQMKKDSHLAMIFQGLDEKRGQHKRGRIKPMTNFSTRCKRRGILRTQPKIELTDALMILERF